MKCETHSTISQDSPVAIHDTEGLSAQKLLAYFLTLYGPLEELLCTTESVQAL